MASIVAHIHKAIADVASVVDDPRIPYRQVVIALSTLQTWFELYVQNRQSRCYKIRAPPPALKDHLKPETFTKAQNYGRDKLNYQFASTLFNWALSVALIYFGVYSSMWDRTAKWMDAFGLAQSRVIVHSLIWMTAIAFITSIAGLPWNYYFTFVLEQRHGFNKSTPGLWIADTLKSYALMAVIGLPILAGFLKIIELAGVNFVPWLMLFLLAIQLSLQIIYPLFIAPLFNKFTPVPDGEVRTRVEALATKLKFPLKHLYVIDGSRRSAHSNAYFYGLPWSKQIVLYDTLLEKSSPAEVEAVLAHELGHWKFAHPTSLLLIAQAHLFFTLVIFSVFIHNKALYASFGFDPRLAVESPVGGPQPIIIGFMLYQLLFEPLDTVVKFLMNATTRKFEYQADEFAVHLGCKEDLKAALIKLHVDNLSSPHSDTLYSMYHHSHPTLPERLHAMDEYSGGQWLEKKPNAKPEAKKDL